jgi:hypothetical protein
MATTLTVKANITIFTSGKTEILYETSPGFFVEEADFVQFAKEKRAVLEGEVAKAKTLGKKARIKAFLKKAIGERMAKKAKAAEEAAKKPKKFQFSDFNKSDIESALKYSEMTGSIRKENNKPGHYKKSAFIKELQRRSSVDPFAYDRIFESLPDIFEKKDLPKAEEAKKAEEAEGADEFISFIESLPSQKSKAKSFTLGQVRKMMGGSEKIPKDIRSKPDDYRVKIHTKGLTIVFTEDTKALREFPDIEEWLENLTKIELIEDEKATDANVDAVVQELRDSGDYGDVEEEAIQANGGYDAIVEAIVRFFKKKGYTVAQIKKGMRNVNEGYTMFDDYLGKK